MYDCVCGVCFSVAEDIIESVARVQVGSGVPVRFILLGMGCLAPFLNVCMM